MPQPLIQYTKPTINSDEGKLLIIRNYGKIRGLAYYDDGSWEPLAYTHQKRGAKAYIEWIEEGEESYRMRLLYILPQPDSAMVTIWRDGKKKAGKEMWRVEMDKGGIKYLDEWWKSSEFERNLFLEAIRISLID